MKSTEIVRNLRRLKIQTGGIQCLGCGYEHDCSIHGCCIMREAADLIEELVARIKELEAEKTLEAQKGNTKVKAGYALPKERWREAAENLQMAGNFVAAFFREKNFDGRGEQDAQDWLADASLACVALLYVAEFATDKCRIVPLPEAPKEGS